MDCTHRWKADPTSLLYEDCVLCECTRKVREYCPMCQGKRWNPGTYLDEEGYQQKYRAPCGHCGASGLIVLAEPKLL